MYFAKVGVVLSEKRMVTIARFLCTGSECWSCQLIAGLRCLAIVSVLSKVVYVTVSGKRGHSAQNVHSSVERFMSTEVNLIELHVNVHRGSMIP